MNRFISLLFVAVFLSGCSSSKGFNREQLRSELTVKRPEVSEEKIKNILEKKPQLPRPFRIAVFFNEPQRILHHHNNSVWRWSDHDKNSILGIKDKLQSKNEISDIFIINSSIVGNTDLKSLRLAAAQHGADALLIIQGTKQDDRYSNKWAWTYIALVTAFFVPASKLDVLFLAQASMWDVRNEYLYLTAEAETIKGQTRPAYFIDDRPLLEEAKQDSMNKLRNEIVKRIEASIGNKNKGK
jgi:hypothetical protein